MATRAPVPQQKVVQLQEFVVEQLEEARRQVLHFEKEILTKGKAQRREMEQLIKRVRSGKELKAIRTRADKAGGEVKKAFDGLQSKVVSAVGVASQTQVQEINKELNRLAKKIDGLVKKNNAPSA